MAVRSGVRDIYPLSPMQEGMLFHALAASGAPLYLQQYVLALRGADEAALTAACQDLVARHTVLRTGFVWEGVDRPVQVVFDRAGSPLTVADLRGHAGTGTNIDAEIDRALIGHREQPFDLARPPLLRIHALRTGTDEWILITTHHHIVLDGWSVPLLHAELAELLAARADGRVAEPAPARPYGDFIRWLRSREADASDASDAADADAYWRSRLSEFALATPLGVDRVGRVSAPPGEAAAGRVIRLDRAIGALRVTAAARKHGLLPSTIVHAAWGLLLARYSGQTDVVYGLTTAGRPAELPEADRRLGMFVNTLPLRVRCGSDTTVSRWLADVQQDLAKLRELEQTPLRTAQGYSRIPTNRPLYESVVAFQNYWRSDMDAHQSAGIDLKVLRTWERTSVPVAVAVALPDEGLWVRLDHDESRIDGSAAAEMVRHFCDLVDAVVDSLEADDGRTLADVTLRVAEREPTDGGVAEFTAELAARSGARAVVLLASDDPAAEVVAALCAGAGLSVTRSEPGSAVSVDLDGARVLAGPPRTIDRLSGAGLVADLVALIGDEPAAVPGDATAFRLMVVGDRWTAARLPGPRDAGRIAAGQVLTVTDAHGAPVPEGVEGTLRALGEPTGRIARVRADGDIEVSGFDDGSHTASVWAARVLATHPEVADAAVVGPTAWIVPRPGRTPATASLAVHAGRHIPAHLAPTGFEIVDRLPLDARGHVNRAALAAQPPTRTDRRRATPLQDRLAAVPATVRAAFLDAIRNPPERGPRPGRRRGEAVRSVPQQQLDDLRGQAIAGTAEARIRLPEAPSPAALADALRTVCDRHGLSAHQLTATVDPSGDLALQAEAEVADATSAAHLATELATLLSGAELPAPPPVTYADYAAWQRDDRRHADLDTQRRMWRTALAGAPALGLFPDRVPADAAGIGEQAWTPAADHEGIEAIGAPTWLAAVAVALARRARADDLVIGAVLRPDLPASLDTVIGAFERMLPIRVSTEPDQGIATVAGQVQAAVTAAAGAADVPWSELRALLAEDIPVSVAVHTAGPERTAPHAGTGLALDISRTTILARFDRALWHPALVRTLLADIAGLATAGVAPVDGTDPVLAWGDGGLVPGDDAATIHALVAHQAAIRPDAVAVDGPTGRLTYRELAAAVDRISGRLRALGIGPEDRVAVCVPRGPAMVAAALGVLASGAAYVPVDPHWPEQRTAFVLADSHATTVVTVRTLTEKFGSAATIVTIDATDATDATDAVDATDETQPEQAPDAAAPPPTPDRAAAYILYTSGSTGRPKGVVVEHRAVVNFVRHIASAYHIGGDTRLLGFAPLTFDISVFDIWTALTAGATLVLAGEDERRSVDALQRLLEDHRVDTAELPPSLLPLLDAARLPELRLVSVGGEAPPGAVVDAWAGPHREVWNGYGPTETTVAVTLHRCLPPSGGRIPPIGRPMPNHRVYVVDDALRLVPPGVPGELCVAGAGLARGYLGSPGMTADRFVPDPHAVTPGQRMYRTGDLVRWTGDGILEFLGRVDRQVKVRGFRVELGEVEAALAEHPGVAQAVVEPRDIDGTRHLVAYVVSAEPLELAELRGTAAHRLPDYMLPTRTLHLERLPLTPHGKVDRRALSGLALAAGPPAAVEAAADETEQAIITDIISPLLGGQPVGPHDGFFALGGNSLQATQVTSRVRDRFGVDIDLADFFADPTPRRLAQMVAEAIRVRQEEQESLFGVGGGETELEDGSDDPDDVPVALAFPQERMWRMDVLEPGHPSHHAPFHIGMSGAVDAAALRQAVQSVVDRHAPLRAVFTATEQRFLPEVRVPLRRVETDADTVPRLLREEAERPFDLRRGPMVRTTLYHLGGAEYVFQWNVHHIVTDAWSVGRMLGEVFSAYNAVSSGRPPAFEPLPAHYRDFVRWQRDYVRSPAYERELGWWRAKLAGLDGHPELPADHARGTPFTFGWRNVRLDAEQGAAALATARRHGVTFYMLALAAWSLTLTAETEGDELVVAAPVAGRIRTEWEPLIGYFVNRVLTRVPLGRARQLGDLLDLVRAETAAAFAHQTVPFESLVTELALPPRALATCFSVQNAPTAGEGFSGLRLASVADDTGRDFTPIMELYSPVGSRFEAGMVLRERAGGVIAGGLEYNASLFSPERAERWDAGFRALLDRAAADPRASVADLRRAALGG